jgi:hypothetical protein
MAESWSDPSDVPKSPAMIAMNDHYSVTRLERAMIPRTYPLLQASGIALAFEEWINLAHALSDEGERGVDGVRIVVTREGYVHGLFSCRATSDIACGRVLMVDCLILLDLVEARLLRTVMDATEVLAIEAGCAAIHVALPEWRSQALLRAGYRPEALRLCKRLIAG